MRTGRLSELESELVQCRGMGFGVWGWAVFPDRKGGRRTPGPKRLMCEEPGGHFLRDAFSGLKEEQKGLVRVVRTTSGTFHRFIPVTRLRLGCSEDSPPRSRSSKSDPSPRWARIMPFQLVTYDQLKALTVAEVSRDPELRAALRSLKQTIEAACTLRAAPMLSPRPPPTPRVADGPPWLPRAVPSMLTPRPPSTPRAADAPPRPASARQYRPAPSQPVPTRPASAGPWRPMTSRGPVIVEQHYMLIGPMELRCIGKTQSVMHDWGQRGRPLTRRHRKPSVYTEPPLVRQAPRGSWQMSQRRGVPMGTWRSTGPESVDTEHERSFSWKRPMSADEDAAGQPTLVRSCDAILIPIRGAPLGLLLTLRVAHSAHRYI